MVSLQDPRLRRAVPREQWQLGSSLEIFANTDKRWNVGWIVNVLHEGLKVLFMDGDSPNMMKMKVCAHDDSQLASLGTNIRRLPPNFELASDCALVQRGTGWRCHTFEEAWKAHFDMYVRHNWAGHFGGTSQNGGVTMRAAVMKGPPGSMQHLSVQPVPTQVLPSSLLPPGVSYSYTTQAGAGATAQLHLGDGGGAASGGSFIANALQVFEPSAEEQIAQLQQSYEEVDRQRCAEAQAANEARQQVEQLQLQVERLHLQVDTMRVEREQLRKELRAARKEASQSPDETLNLSAIPDHEDSPHKVERTLSVNRSFQDRSVGEILVSIRVPRVFTPEERLEEEQKRLPPAVATTRSQANFAPGVMRIPSAPVQPVANMTGHRLAVAGHRGSFVHVALAGSQQQLQMQPQQQQVYRSHAQLHQAHQPHMQASHSMSQAAIGIQYRQ
mmetsp:Transcript_103876/g.292321  ORF Transcript_103876/g.292321 Transcript_103876/m.292321 type:complete len:443 (-) Transcript_103876:134-1462(-)